MSELPSNRAIFQQAPQISGMMFWVRSDFNASSAGIARRSDNLGRAKTASGISRMEYTVFRRKKNRRPDCEIGPSGFLAERSRLSCCGFGFSDFSDDAELLHQA